MIRFLLTAAVLALGLPPIIDLMYSRDWIPGIPSYLYETTWFVAVTTGILFVYRYRSRQGSYFVRFYLLSLVIKFLAYLTYNVIIILQDRTGAALNAAYFLVVYFVFTTIEIGFLNRKISRPSER